MNALVTEPSLPAWPHGLLVEVTPSGLLLKPRPKPRQGWTEGFKTTRAPEPNEAELRAVKNQFDDAEWEW